LAALLFVQDVMGRARSVKRLSEIAGGHTGLSANPTRNRSAHLIAPIKLKKSLAKILRRHAQSSTKGN
jgi:hypothetical protein